MSLGSFRKKLQTAFRPHLEALEDRRAPAVDLSSGVEGDVVLTSDPGTAGPPTATLTAQVVGKKVVATFTNQDDPLYTNDEAGFQYSFAFDGEDLNLVEKSGSADAHHKYKNPGTHTIRARIYNKDGLFTEYSTNVTVKLKTIFLTGAGAGGGPHVKVFDHQGVLKHSFFAYSPQFSGGVAVAKGDFNDDGILDIVTAAGPGGGPHVRILDGSNLQSLASFYAYDANFHGGVTVAVGDLNGDGRVDLITGMATGGSEVKAIDGSKLDKIGTPEALRALMYKFEAFPGHTGGVNVAAGDVTGDGKADIIAGMASFGGQVALFNGPNGAHIRTFGAFGPFSKTGVTVAAGDLDGDGMAELLLGQEGGNGAQLRVIRASDSRVTASITPFVVSPTAFQSKLGIIGGIPNGVRVALADLDGDGRAELIVSSRHGFKPRVRVYRGVGQTTLFDFDAYTSLFMGGVHVG